MDDAAFNSLSAWVTEAGLIGRTETELMAGFCRRVVEAGIPLARALVILDTLHPIYEGRAFLWRADRPETTEIVEYGRTNEGEAAENWRRSVFFHLLQSGEKMLRRRLVAGDPVDFLSFKQARNEGMTDYLALIHRFADEGVIGEMDCVYSSWATDAPQGFDDTDIAALQRLAPFLNLAVKSAALARMAGTLAETYLGRDPGKRVMSGRIVRELGMSRCHKKRVDRLNCLPVYPNSYAIPDELSIRTPRPNSQLLDEFNSPNVLTIILAPHHECPVVLAN